MIDAILFDLNGTLLDLAALGPHFARLFGDAALCSSSSRLRRVGPCVGYSGSSSS